MQKKRPLSILLVLENATHWQLLKHIDYHLAWDGFIGLPSKVAAGREETREQVSLVQGKAGNQRFPPPTSSTRCVLQWGHKGPEVGGADHLWEAPDQFCSFVQKLLEELVL